VLNANIARRFCGPDIESAGSFVDFVAISIALVRFVANFQASDLPCNIKQQRQMRMNSSPRKIIGKDRKSMI
jgi:hypothetical protein